MQLNAVDKFSTWATSYAGCDGGNISGNFWFCGIEFGGNKDPKTIDMSPIITPPSVSDKRRKNSFVRKSRYNQNLLRLYSYILGLGGDYGALVKNYPAFSISSNEFKLNLYPIGFPDDGVGNWSYEHFQKTGLLSKRLYQAWCQMHRFPKLNELQKENNPSIIVCTGISYAIEFFMAFGNKKAVFEHNNIDLGNKKTLKWCRGNEGKTLVFVTPFLGGRHGLNSKILQHFCAEQIRKVAVEEFGQKKWDSIIEMPNKALHPTA